MWNFISPVNLIRYLIAWRVNSSLVQLPRCLPAALSQVMGTLIANRLSTQQARQWRKALEAWDSPAAAVPPEKPPKKPTLGSPPVQGPESGGPYPSQRPLDVAWPVEVVLFAHPGKRTYGRGEAILWELKLVGDSADHGLFLELILPAIEEAASTSDPRWHRPNGLWGRFDIQSVYAARGARWEPVVREGRLDLNYRASSIQWAEGLTFGQDPNRRFHRLIWITPFDLRKPPDLPGNAPRSRPARTIPPSREEIFPGILDALMDRMTLFLPGKNRTAKDAWALLSTDEQATLQLALQQAKPHPLQGQPLKPAPKGWPEGWIGTQTFATIPDSLLPYLELASILHIGKQTHFGCGTFTLTG